jgi:AraC-like DNA-binding protein
MLRPAKINFYLKFMRERGHAAEQVLAGTGISPRNLADPHHLVEISRYIRIITNIKRISRSASLAFELGESLRLGDLGILGYSVMSCVDTNEATRLWHQYNPVFFGNLITMEAEAVNSKLLLTYLPYTDIRDELLQFLIEEKICCDMALQRLIGIERFPVERITLTYPLPSNLDRYIALIGCPIEFSAARSTMLLTANAMAIPLQGHDAETHAHCLKLLESVFNSVNAGATLSQKVRAILQDNLHLGIEEVADSLCCTARTLSRRLQKENLSFTDLLISIRLEAIQNLLATTRLEGKAIAERVGFSDVHSLHRFFKAHIGKTIQQFRRETTGKLD